MKRGVPIGSYTSQPICNYCVDFIEHYIKEVMHVKCHLRYCDDRTTLTRTKAEAKRVLKAQDEMAVQSGLCIKHSAIIAPIEHYERKRKRRKRMRSTRKKNRLSRLSIQP